MTQPLHDIADRIRTELTELEIVVNRINSTWEVGRRNGDDYYIDSVALNLHGFYSGLERIFELIAAKIDGNLPVGANWHQNLLSQMCDKREGLRPAVISQVLCEKLNEYRGFRHVVRNVYTFHFDPEKIYMLVKSLTDVFKDTKAELLAFADFIDRF